MPEPDEIRADSTREQILRAAAEQFARHPYHQVNLDDILERAQVTKGALYSQFRSKTALAVAVVEQQATFARTAALGLLTTGLSALETVIDLSYVLAVRDATDTVAQATLNLLDAIGRTEGLRDGQLTDWVSGYTNILEQARADGDLLPTAEPVEVAKVLIALHTGAYRVSDLDDPEDFLHTVEAGWLHVLPAIVTSERVEYFRTFVQRRTAVAVKKTESC